MKKKIKKISSPLISEQGSLFFNIVNLANEAVVVLDEQQNIVFFNQGAERIFGYPAADVIGQSIAILLPPVLSEIHFAHVKAFSEESQMVRDMENRREIAGRHKSGLIFPAEASILKVSEDGKLFFVAILQDITERKQVQQRVLLQEQRYRNIVETQVELLCRLLPDGTITFVNQSYLDYFGYTLEEVVGIPVDSLDGRASITKTIVASLTAQQASAFFEEMITQPDGAVRWVQWVCRAMLNSQGDVKEVQAVGRDITEIKQTEIDLRQSEKRLQETQRISHVGSWDFDFASNRLFWSDEVYRIFELNREGLSANYEEFLRVVHPHDRNMVSNAYMVSLRTREPYQIVYRLQMADGRIKYVEHRYESLYDEAGAPARLAGMIQDITERKQAEDLLTIKDRAIASSISAVSLADLQGNITYVNEAFLLMWGYDNLHEILGKQAISFLESEERGAEVVRAIQEEGSWIGELGGKKNNGVYFDVLVSASLVYDGLGMPICMMGSFLDITERKRIEMELIEREKSLNKIMNAAPFGSHVYELIQDDLIILDANQASDEILGRNHLSLVGKKLEHVLPAFMDTELPAIFKQVAEQGGKYDIAQFSYRDDLVQLMLEIHVIQIAPNQIASFFRNITELAKAYDETLVGWSHAMDLRDKETEGHTQRVTDLTMQLARAMKIVGENDLLYMRWGALLHDMGKIGIPDGILLKADSLTDEEKAFMRKHPQFAYEMLFPITFLRPALDIPYCHHEKWDGSGYPRGLKGEQIPLAARIFALADVWDALRSDRPYRKKWSEEKTIEHIRASEGTHFDPMIVKIFLELIDKKKFSTVHPVN